MLHMVPVTYSLQIVLFSNISLHVKQTKQLQRVVTVLSTIFQMNCFYIIIIFTPVGFVVVVVVYEI